ncbi:MAG: substrate-binding domain-containing protein [Eubacteriales bacterium]|nr:substrate-binding domain-containing protein [Eubacteriales bacterium]
MSTAIAGTACAQEATADPTAIHIYTRDAASGTREGFETVVGLKGELTDLASEVASNGEMVNRVGNDPSGIGYVSLVTNFAENNLKPLVYNGVAPTMEAAVSGEYTLSRPFSYTTRAAGDYDSEEKEQLIEAFVTFLTKSTEGLEAVLDAGGIVDVSMGIPWDELKSDYPIVNQDNRHVEIRSGGSTSVEKTVQSALETFQVHAGYVQFSIDQTGSSDGWSRVLGDEKDGPNSKDIGFASRYFGEDEPTNNAISSGVFCQDAIAVVVNVNNNYIDEASTEQLYAIFSGTITKWNELRN